ncbi:hypothetical protein ACI0ZS_000299 [Cronobacter turicensis]
MSEMSKEHDGKLRELCDDLKRWQGYYDPVDDKGQHEMFVRAADAVTELLALRKEREATVPVAVAGFDAAEAIRACMDEFPESVHDIVEECAQIAENTISTRHTTPPAQPVAVPVVPDGLRIALSNAGIAAPESDEMLWASQQDYIQMLVTWVKDRKPFKPVAVPDDEQLRALFDSWFASDCSFDRSPDATEEDNIAWRESYWYVWQRCRAAMLAAAPGKN